MIDLKKFIQEKVSGVDESHKKNLENFKVIEGLEPTKERKEQFNKMLGQVKDKITATTEKRLASTKPLRDAVKEINAPFNSLEVLLEKIKVVMIQKLGTIEQHERNEQIAAQKKEQDRVAKEIEAAEEAARIANSKEAQDKAKADLEGAKEHQLRQKNAPQPKPKTNLVKVSKFVWEVIDLGRVPEKFTKRVLDQDALEEFLKKQSKDSAPDIEGIKITLETKTIHRR